MAKPVKRTYDNSRRLAQTRVTRAKVVDVARELFVRDGYTVTTIEAIGDAADVPLATIYRLFNSKVGILQSVLDVSFGGDDEPVAFGDRPNVRAALADDKPARLLDEFADIATHLLGRSAPLQHVLASAAEVDADAAALLVEIRRQRFTGQSRIIDALASRGALRNGMSRAEARDITYLLMSPDAFRVLTDERGWRPDRYQRWLATTLKTLLLGT